MRLKYLGCVAILLGLIGATPLNAQDAPTDDPLADETDQYVPNITSRNVIVWCSALNGDRQEFYLSQMKRLKSTSPLAIGSMSGHFAQTVNARFGTHLAMNAPHCRSFRKAAAAESARMLEVGQAKKQGLSVVDPGIF
ncbi:hypothetical protein [Acetobacter conturbans]|uniref:Uncharacterized protein n=1 Tax=Acetobacter conturbans TaxID=1737472 RepID=A0ABX0K1H9_9PROT|nr:hypothetical protein [Acetobacter conturbans]NHN87579.1 hypothetical protein [Acetobacter conturbans]